jgi:ABC-type uncharacterized transport system substrate-binding protein
LFIKGDRRVNVQALSPFFRAAFLALSAVMVVPCVGEAAGYKVTVVKSRALPPFDQAAQEFKKCLSAKGVQATFQDLTLPNDDTQAEAAMKDAGEADLFFTLGAQASILAREKLKTPSVFAMVLDPAASGLAKGGVSMDPSPNDYVEYIKVHFPQFKRIGILYNPAKTQSLVDAYKALRIAPYTFVFQEVSNLGQLDAAVRALQQKADCLLMVPDSTVYTSVSSSQILLQSLQLKLPFIALSSSFVKGGALAGLYADWKNNGCLGADLAARALKGEPPTGLPLLGPNKLNSSINMIVGDRLGVRVSPATQAAAEEVLR